MPCAQQAGRWLGCRVDFTQERKYTPCLAETFRSWGRGRHVDSPQERMNLHNRFKNTMRLALAAISWGRSESDCVLEVISWRGPLSPPGT